MISILILTKNEQQDLPGCLESVAWSDDIHVYDSLSDDNTLEIAKAAGATITSRKFDNWSSHQNWGLQNIPFKHEWVFYIDADERMSAELKDAICSAAETSNDNIAYRVQRRDFFMGTWLKHVQASAFYIRLFKPGHILYERLVNPLTVADGPIGEVTGYLNHYPFSKGVTHWLERHNSYSTFEAKQIMENRQSNKKFSVIKAFTEKDFNERRFHQKEIFYRLPGRPLIKFFLLYIVKRGFLDGRAGITYAVLQSIYEYMIVLKTREFEAPSQPQ